jgi:hypothetical protein
MLCNCINRQKNRLAKTDCLLSHVLPNAQKERSNKYCLTVLVTFTISLSVPSQQKNSENPHPAAAMVGIFALVMILGCIYPKNPVTPRFKLKPRGIMSE